MASYRLVPGAGDFPFHVIDERGVPHSELTLYASKAVERHAEKTARAYSRELVAFASWASADEISIRQGWTLLGPSSSVRSLVSRFLTSQLKYTIALKRDKLGFETRKVETTWGTKRRSVSHLLAGLNSFYRLLHRCGLYGAENPMEGDDAEQLIAEERRRTLDEFARSHGRQPMPSSSGVDGVRFRKATSSYFRSNKEDWVPELIDDPNLQDAVMRAGESWGWRYRESGVARVLFDSGCRIHEACGLTLRDWHFSGFGREVRAINKGSGGQRVNTLFLSDRTVKVLHLYLNDERSRLDSSLDIAALMHGADNALLDSPLFMTARGTSLHPDYFRRYFWTPALAAVGMKLTPHQVRHWFVSMALHAIMEEATSPEEVEQARAKLRTLMAWRSDMLPVYDQAVRKLKLPELARQIHSHIENAQAKVKPAMSQEHERLVSSTEAQLMLDEMLAIQ